MTITNIERPKARNPYAEAYKNLLKNKMAVTGAIILILFIMCALFADYIAPFPYDLQISGQELKPPSPQHFFGTDKFGRDIFSRIVYGSRISLLVGFIAVFFAATIGGSIGALAGYYRNKLDNVLMRLMDILLAIPSILLAISVINILGPGLFNVMLSVGISNIPTYARIVRASVISIRDREFIEAAKAIGDNDISIILYNILPNCMAPIIVQATLGVAQAILSAAALSFLGLGLQPPTPEWGAMLSEGRQYIFNAYWATTYPGLAIVIIVLSLNLFGDGLRDALDPKLKR